MLNSQPKLPIAKETAQADAFLANQLVNRFTHTNAIAYYAIYGSLISYFLIKSMLVYSLLTFFVGVFSGLLIWSLIEYLTHRYLFHWVAGNSVEKLLVFLFHGVHHAYPQAVARSITPLVVSLPVAAGFYFLYQVLFGAYYLAIFAGFLLGYVCYTIIHDSTHHYPMNFLFGKQLKRHHMNHHYFNGEKNFGVSSPLWDVVFRTRTSSR